MAKSYCVVLLLLIINLGNYFVVGQSTSGDCNNDEQDFQKYFSDALVALTKSIQLESQNLKVQMQLENMAMRNELKGVCQKLPSPGCPRGFNYSVAGFSKCYAVINEGVNWNTAQQRCRQLHENAQLTIIVNSLETQITTELLRDHDCPQQTGPYRFNQFWIGARRGDVSDCSSTIEWISSNGVTFPIQYTNWHSGEPNCHGSGESCATIDKRRNFKWNDVACNFTACPLCEVTIRA